MKCMHVYGPYLNFVISSRGNSPSVSFDKGARIAHEKACCGS